MLFALGFDHKRADLALRERFQPTAEGVARIYQCHADAQVAELVLVSTCNRIELYVARGSNTDSRDARAAVEALVRAWVPNAAEANAFLEASGAMEGEEAIRHLMRVACGLDSQILGDVHILGQLKKSFKIASAAGGVGSTLDRVFSRVFRAGKRVRTETALMSGRISFGSRAAQIAARWAKTAGGLAEKRCVVVGCGKTGGAAARSLLELGARSVAVTNRTHDRAVALASELPALSVFAYEDLDRAIDGAEIVIAATASPTPVISASTLRERAPTPRLFIDVSLPRNIDPCVAELPGVTLIDLDTLDHDSDEHAKSRQAAIGHAEAIIDEETRALMDWFSAAPVRESLQPLFRSLQEICLREVAFAAGEEVAERTAQRIVAKFMARPMSLLCASGEVGADALAEKIGRLFCSSSPEPAFLGEP